MNPLLLVVILVAASMAIVACVALYRGWFRLAAVVPHDKFQFILMRKKQVIPEVEKNTPVVAKEARPQQSIDNSRRGPAG